MSLSRLEYLFKCYTAHECSEAEEKELMVLLTQSENEPFIKKLIEGVINNTGSEIKLPKEVSISILENILEKNNAKIVSLNNRRRIRNSWIKVAAAATIILFISGISYWIFNKENTEIKRKVVANVIPSGKATQILPGGNHAILTMADGTTILLDSLQNGNLQHGSATIKKQNGLLVIDGSMPSKTIGPPTYNTLATPRGGQYQVVLPDGSKVWLNASSSLRFPTAFVGKQRDVDLTGEAYFEVAKNKEKPFHINVKGVQVEVLGTHFNVNAYSDESCMKTSLLEGSVRIKEGSQSGLLKPGQQAVIKNKNENIEIKNADMDEVIAWKNGLFQFHGANITTIMREIGRWYDVDIVYEDKISNRSFEGKISRNVPLSDVLKILELSNVKFSVEGKQITVHS